jgi:hypothetical protein
MSTHRNRLVRFRAALAMTAIAATAGSGAASAASMHKVRVSGSLVRAPSSATDVPFTFSVNASAPAPHAGVDGTFSGSFPHDPYPTPDRFPAPGNWATFSGVVTCLVVSGEVATVGGVITSGYGYDSDATTSDTYSLDQHGLAGDWFIVAVQDPKGDKSPDSMSYVDFGSSTYFSLIWGYPSFSSLCADPTADIGAPQFGLAAGDIKIDS